jgi:DNA-binding NtrC family response regulator
LLIVDDDPSIQHSVGEYFLRKGHQVLTAGTGEEALKLFQARNPELILLDLKLPDADGLDLLEKMRALAPESIVITLTGYADVETAVKAMRWGAANFLTKPVSLKAIEAAFAKAQEHARTRREVNYLRRSALGDLREEPPQFPEAILKLAERASQSATVPVLLLGDTGAGKGTLARYIHQKSPRREKPFVEINCANLSKERLESELFGHERGAFTDARERKRGLMEIAHEGTLFLDEIGETPLSVQAKFLTAIETGEFRRMGSTSSLKVDARLLAATSGEPERLLADGRLRKDLYYRINVLSIRLPPLRERKDEIMTLAERFRGEFCSGLRKKISGFSEEAKKLLVEHDWPGNVRELRNWVERAVLLCESPAIQPSDFPAAEDSRVRAAEEEPGDGLMPLQEAQVRHVERVMKAAGNNQSRAAEILEISRPTLRKYLRKQRP